MESCDEATARIMGESLLSHAKEIHRYANTFCAPSAANRVLEPERKRKFVKTVERMINEMHSLMLMAGYKGIARYCNQEQIEAYIDGARLAIAAPAAVEKQSEPLFN